ncbi:hypothetical protein Bind_3137 [Beijerinckia indica subsp. indica ATCC 9039]|uniref:Uncharacterized protein n=1 Tax=Beijerinckia indica subsp. indica (strain ATCC 9039 / DSM 1715 / NCIMB 8712) TaxID=395963 RepID=B2ICA1_BEII9|nr:hypothetical protein Bind_3137 [Beijerinckia indica subsp. indica ATCC 9039]
MAAFAQTHGNQPSFRLRFFGLGRCFSEWMVYETTMLHPIIAITMNE